MKFNKISLLLLSLATILFVGCKNEDVKGEHHFDNKLYIASAKVDSDLLIKDDITEISRAIFARTAKTADSDIAVTFGGQPELAAQYNMMYADKAIALPSEYYDIPEPVSVIKVGNVAGNEVVVNFTNTNELDRNKRYVLPVSIVDASNIDVLESARTIYYVFKGAALINVVANITNIHFPINWGAGVNVTSLKTITIEALVRSSDWEAGRDNALSTVFGIEGRFLLRIGDADRPRNQLQLSTSGSGNWPAPNAAPGLPVNEWIHIAVVFNSNSGERIYYQNGKVVASDRGASGSYTLSGGNGCYIGKAYDNTRWFPGEVAEMRVWNIERTEEQIASSIYYVNPESNGLLAYWKFNEGDGSAIRDATGKGTNLTAVGGTPKWVPVSLPEIKE